jgi:hypothetical protein
MTRIIGICFLLALSNSAFCRQDRSKVVIPDRYLVVQNVPRMLKEFQFIWLEELTGTGLTGVLGKAYVKEEFVDLKGSIQGHNFSFTVTGHKEVTYRFTGHFLKERVPNGFRPVLEGTLKKSKHGHQLASARIRFEVGEGGNQ